MSSNLALMSEVGSRALFKLPKNFDLDAYCFEFCQELTELSRSATGEGEGEGEGVANWSWDGSEAQRVHIRRTPIWNVFNDIYQYAEFGDTDFLCFRDGQWMYGDDTILFAIEWISALTTRQETAGFYLSLQHGILLIHKFLARYKLDGNSLDKDEYVITNGCAHLYLPLLHQEHISIYELGLLAGMTNLRSVRNAVYAKDKPLVVFKEGGKVLTTVADSRKWLSDRRGFTPSKNINYDETFSDLRSK